MYDLRRLRSLCAIADHGSLTGAAAALDFTQPAVSQHLAALEAEVGAPLVRRSRGGAELTPAGALLVEHARAALDRLALAEQQVADLVGSEQGRVRLAANSSALTRLVPLAIADLRRRLPNADVTISECGPRKALAKLLRGDIDLAVTFRRLGAEAPPGVEERTLLEEPMYAVVPRTHALAKEDTVDLAALRDDAWIQGPSATSPGLIRDALPRGRVRAEDRVRERRPARDARDRRGGPRRQPGPIADPRGHRARAQRRRAAAARPAASPRRGRDRGRRPPHAGDAGDGRVARASRGSNRPEHRLACSPMAAERIDGKAIAQDVRAQVKRDVAAWVEQGHEPPGLATVLVGDDPASALYVGNKQKASAEVGIQGFDHRLPQDTAHDEVDAILQELAADPRVSGILLQLPTPPQVDGSGLAAMIPPGKDVDGLTPVSAGLLAQGRPGLRPCTPSGIMELLRRHDVELEGAEAVVVGRSDLVGRPISSLLLAANATVTVCHSRTRDLAEVCRRADVLVAAVGRPGLIQGDWIKPGATVIDVGSPVGDVDFEAAVERAGLITPVPGGVGPMTIAMLLRNTLLAAQAAAQPVGAGSS